MPRIDYAKPKVCVNDRELPLSGGTDDSVVVSSLGVKKFRSMLRKKNHAEDFKVFHLRQKPPTMKRSKASPDRELENILSHFDDVFQDALLAELPPIRTVDHDIEIEEGAKPPLRPLYQILPAELVDVKKYVVENLKKGKIRQRKSPFGESLFLMKEKDKLHAVVDYRALNRLTKRKKFPLPRLDEMFDRLAGRVTSRSWT